MLFSVSDVLFSKNRHKKQIWVVMLNDYVYLPELESYAETFHPLIVRSLKISVKTQSKAHLWVFSVKFLVGAE